MHRLKAVFSIINREYHLVYQYVFITDCFKTMLLNVYF